MTNFYEGQLDNPNKPGVEKHLLPFNWPVVGMLFFLTAIPGIPAILIIALVLAGPEAVEGASGLINQIYFDTPAAVLLHGGSGVLFFLTMPFQFSPKLRNKYIKWHKAGGKIATVSAFTMAISGVWMHHVLLPGDFGMRYWALVAMSIAICLCFVMGLRYVMKRKIDAHRKWMARGVAIVLAAVTPLFLEGLLAAVFSHNQSTMAMLVQLQYDYGRLVGIFLNLIILEVTIWWKKHKTTTHIRDTALV